MEAGSQTNEHAESDERLVQQWCEGDQRAADQLVRRYLPAIHRFFCNKTGGREDIADLVNQTFLACAEARGRFGHEARFRSFLYGIARNVLYGYYRSRKRRRREDDDFLEICVEDLFPRSLSSIVCERREAALLVAALRRVPVADQEVLELRYFSDFDATQISELLDVPAATVRGRLMRARTRLRAAVSRLATASDESSHLLQGELPVESWAQTVRGRLDRVEHRLESNAASSLAP